MSDLRHKPAAQICARAQEQFSAYLDSTMSGAAMVALQRHLDTCAGCAAEFAAWREVQRSLAELGPAAAPERLQAQLRLAIGVERERGSNLSWNRRALRLWQTSIAPAALGGLAAAMVLAGGMAWLFAAPISVQANDDRLAHLAPPRYLYSQVPPQPINTAHDAPIVVEALVDEQGRVYDYHIVQGPQNAAVQVRVEDNLLASVFKPATVFGVPVRGHVVMTYTGVSVRG
jgi:hypothetical protein